MPLPTTHQQAIITSTTNVVFHPTITHNATAPSTYHFIYRNSIVSTLIQPQIHIFLLHIQQLIILFTILFHYNSIVSTLL